MIALFLVGTAIADAQKSTVKTKVTITITKAVVDMMTAEETASLINTGYADSINTFAIGHLKALFTKFVRSSMEGRNTERPVAMPKDVRFFAGKIKTLPCRNIFKQITADVFLRQDGWNYSYDVCVFDSIILPYCKHDSIYKERIMDGYLSVLNCDAQCIRCGTNMHYLTIVMTDKSFAKWADRYKNFLILRVDPYEFYSFSKLNQNNKLGEEMNERFITELSSEKVNKLIGFRPEEAKKIIANASKGGVVINPVDIIGIIVRPDNKTFDKYPELNEVCKNLFNTLSEKGFFSNKQNLTIVKDIREKYWVQDNHNEPTYFRDKMDEFIRKSQN